MSNKKIIGIKPEHKAFCHALIKLKFNQTRAYMEVYPDVSYDSAMPNACRLLRNAKIRAYLDTLKADLDAKDLICIEELIEDTKDIITRSMKKEPVYEYNKDTKCMEPTGEWKFEGKDALKAIELLGKMKGAFTEKLDVKVQHITIGEPPKPEG
jgi:phage terminase small subunit